MALAKPYAVLQGMTVEQLVEEYNLEAARTEAGVSYYLLEIGRRLNAEQTAEMLRLTRNIKFVTWIIGGLTLANVVLVAVTLFWPR